MTLIDYNSGKKEHDRYYEVMLKDIVNRYGGNRPVSVSDPSQKWKIAIALVYGTAVIILLILILIK